MKNVFEPSIVKISKIQKLSSDTKLFRLKKKEKFLVNERGLSFVPGQFVLAGMFGYGEAPFGPSSSPFKSSYMDIIVRRVGVLTEAFHRAKEGDDVSLRGPYGNGFPLESVKGKDVVLVTGGCGLPPIASLAKYIIKNRNDFGRVYLIYGAKSPDDLLMRNKLVSWKKDIEVVLTVDRSARNWSGCVGFVSDFVEDVKINPQNAIVAMCGPQVMMNAVAARANLMGIFNRRIFVNMERKMQCGVGRCQHCTTGHHYVCTDGPVFSFDKIKDNWD